MSLPIENKKSAWLIPISVFGVIAWPIPALFGLLWSRWLRPFSKPGLIGYYLCWFSITLAPFSACYFMFTFKPLLPDRIWQLGLYLLCLVAWILVAKFLIKKPPRSIKKAFLIAISGTLLVAPSMTSGGQFVVFFPLLVTILLNSALPIGHSGIFQLFLSMLLLALPVFIGFLFVYWPSNESNNESAIQNNT